MPVIASTAGIIYLPRSVTVTCSSLHCRFPRQLPAPGSSAYEVRRWYPSRPLKFALVRSDAAVREVRCRFAAFELRGIAGVANHVERPHFPSRARLGQPADQSLSIQAMPVDLVEQAPAELWSLRRYPFLGKQSQACVFRQATSQARQPRRRNSDQSRGVPAPKQRTTLQGLMKPKRASRRQSALA